MFIFTECILYPCVSDFNFQFFLNFGVLLCRSILLHLMKMTVFIQNINISKFQVWAGDSNTGITLETWKITRGFLLVVVLLLASNDDYHYGNDNYQGRHLHWWKCNSILTQQKHLMSRIWQWWWLLLAADNLISAKRIMLFVEECWHDKQGLNWSFAL